MLPQDFVDRMRNMMGAEYEAFEQSYEHAKYQSLRMNPLKAKKDVFLEKAPFTLTEVPWCENGYYYSAEDSPGKHPYHEAGVYYIQEPSAMAVAELLMPQPGERVLDLCAAPGGKTTQVAGKLGQKGLLVTNEIHPARAKILSRNVERMGIGNAVVTNEDRCALAGNGNSLLTPPAPQSRQGIPTGGRGFRPSWHGGRRPRKAPSTVAPNGLSPQR